MPENRDDLVPFNENSLPMAFPLPPEEHVFCVCFFFFFFVFCVFFFFLCCWDFSLPSPFFFLAEDPGSRGPFVFMLCSQVFPTAPIKPFTLFSDRRNLLSPPLFTSFLDFAESSFYLAKALILYSFLISVSRRVPFLASLSQPAIFLLPDFQAKPIFSQHVPRRFISAVPPCRSLR